MRMREKVKREREKRGAEEGGEGRKRGEKSASDGPIEGTLTGQGGGGRKNAHPA